MSHPVAPSAPAITGQAASHPSLADALGATVAGAPIPGALSAKPSRVIDCATCEEGLRATIGAPR